MTKSLQPIPYLMLNGNCKEAVHAYAKLFGATITSITTYREMPEGMPIEDADKDKVVNAQLEFPGGYTLMMGDAHSQYPYTGIQGVTICLNLDTVEEGESVFNQLCEGGEVTMPYTDTFWAKKFGMCKDRFGVDWIINGEVNPTP